MATRHSKQIPIPHRGPRGSPLTEVRHTAPASRTAVVTVAPEGTDTGTPFTVTVISLTMGHHFGRTRRQERFNRNLRFCTRNVIGEQHGSS